MKILNIVDNLRAGGGNRAMIAAAKYSKRLYGHEHTILGLEIGERGVHFDRTPPLIEDAGARMTYGFQLGHGPDKRALRQEIRDHDAVIVHWWGCKSINDLMYFFTKQAPLRAATWYHTGGMDCQNIIRKIETDWADLNVGCCEFVLERSYLRNLPQNRLAYVLAGPDMTLIGDGNPKSHLGYNVGYVGTLNYTKLHRRWVGASAAADIPNAHFHVAGEGRNEGSIMNEADHIAPDKFTFYGHVNPGSIYAKLDVYTQITLRDGSAMALQEAMWYGVPAIVLDRCGPSMMVKNGTNGFVVHTIKEYTQKLEWLYHHPEERKQMGENARAYACTHFGARNAAPAYEEMLQQLVKLPKRIRQWRS